MRWSLVQDFQSNRKALAIFILSFYHDCNLIIGVTPKLFLKQKFREKKEFILF